MVSILLAVYNGENYIKKSIDSVLNQTFKDFELLIGFNGTVDNSKNIVSEYNDSRIRVYDYGNDKGKAKTLNKLIKETNYDWIAIQDDDDIWLENKLEEQIKFCDEYDVIGTQIDYCDEYDNLRNGPNLMLSDQNIKYMSLNFNNQIANTSTLVKKNCIIDVDYWDDDYEGIEDYDLWIKMINKNYNFINLNKTLVHHRIHTNSNFNTMNNINKNNLIIKMLEKNRN